MSDEEMTTWDLVVKRSTRSGDCEAFVDERGCRLSFDGLRTSSSPTPRCLEVAVIGLPDETTGERCCAVVDPAGTGAQVDMAALAGFLRVEGMMVQKIPERWELVDELPRNSAGKVLKAELRDHFERRNP